MLGMLAGGAVRDSPDGLSRTPCVVASNKLGPAGLLLPSFRLHGRVESRCYVALQPRLVICVFMSFRAGASSIRHSVEDVEYSKGRSYI